MRVPVKDPSSTRIVLPAERGRSTDLYSLPDSVTNSLAQMDGLAEMGRYQDAEIYRQQAAVQLAQSAPRFHTLIEGAALGYDALSEEQMITKVTDREIETRVLGVKVGSRIERTTVRYVNGHVVRFRR